MNAFDRVKTFLFSTNLSQYSALDQQRIRTVFVISWFAISGTLVWAITAGALGALLLDDIALLSVLVVGSITVFVAVKRGAINFANYALILTLIGLSSIVLFFSGSDIRFIFLIPPMILAGVVLQRTGVGIVGLTLISLTIAHFSFLIGEGNVDIPTLLSRGIGAVMVLIFVTSVQARFVGYTETLANASSNKMDRLQKAIQILPEMDINATPDDALTQMIRTLRGIYQLRHVSIFLLDEEQQFSRRGRGGMRGLEMEQLSDNDILTLNDTHFLAEAARTRKPVQLALDGISIAVKHVESDASLALAIPMVDQDRVVGVVSIQTDERRIFSTDEVENFDLIISVFTRSYLTQQTLQQQRLALGEQEIVANRVQTQLASLQSQRQERVNVAWGQYLEGRAEDVVGFDQVGGKIIQAEDMPQAMRTALEAGDVYTEVVDDEKMLSVPIQVRGETLGAMTFALPREHIITDRQIELTRIIADRLGTSLESTRLLQQTRLQATRERKASEVANQLYGATDMNVLLRLAADSFNDALGAIQTRIFIEPTAMLSEPGSQPNTNGNGHHSNGDRS